MTIHDLAFFADPTQPTKHGLRFFTKGTELARKHAHLVLVPSEATASECREHGFDPERVATAIVRPAVRVPVLRRH